MKRTLVTKFFADTNILLYTIGPPGDKAARANDLILSGPVISVQVLNEFIRVSTRKMKLPLPVAALALVPIRLASEIVPLSLATHELALEIAAKYQLQIYDANIVAAAELAGCNTLYTEDLQDGQRIGRVTIRNPFV